MSERDASRKNIGRRAGLVPCRLGKKGWGRAELVSYSSYHGKPVQQSPYFRLLEIRILVRIRRCAAAEKAQRLCSRDCVPRARRDEDRIARADHTTFAIELYLARAFENKIKLLRDLVIVPLCPAACLDARFRKALVLYGRIRAIEDRTDSRAVLRDKGRLG